MAVCPSVNNKESTSFKLQIAKLKVQVQVAALGSCPKVRNGAHRGHCQIEQPDLDLDLDAGVSRANKRERHQTGENAE